MKFIKNSQTRWRILQPLEKDRQESSLDDQKSSRQTAQSNIFLKKQLSLTGAKLGHSKSCWCFLFGWLVFFLWPPSYIHQAAHTLGKPWQFTKRWHCCCRQGWAPFWAPRSWGIRVSFAAYTSLWAQSLMWAHPGTFPSLPAPPHPAEQEPLITAPTLKY